MIVAVFESPTIQMVVASLFEEYDPDYPFAMQGVNSPSDMNTEALHTGISTQVGEKLHKLLKCVVDYLEGSGSIDQVFKSSERDLASYILEDDSLMAVLSSGWQAINILDNRGTFTLTY